MKRPKKKAKFRVGQYLNLPVKVLKVDRRWRPERYMIQSCGAGWILEDMVEANELRPLTAKEIGPRRKRG
jgi:hypothetical protein